MLLQGLDSVGAFIDALIAFLIIVLVCLPIHEFGHAWAAVKMGDTQDISVSLKAPNEDASNLVGRWQLRSGGTALPGEPSLTVVIVAGNPVTATPAPPRPF